MPIEVDPRKTLQYQSDIIENNLMAVASNIILARVMGISLDAKMNEDSLGNALEALINMKKELNLRTNLKKVGE